MGDKNANDCDSETYFQDVTLTASPDGLGASRLIRVCPGLYELILPDPENGAYCEWREPSEDGTKGWSTQFMIGQRTGMPPIMELKGLPTRCFTKEEAWRMYPGVTPQMFDAPQPPATGGGVILLIALASNLSKSAHGSMTIRLNRIKAYPYRPSPDDEG